jgi:hypothetical protein
MQRPQGNRAKGSRVGRPHGGDKRRERQERTLQRAIDKGLKKTVDKITRSRARSSNG